MPATFRLKRSELSALLLSAGVHVAVLLSLLFVTYRVQFDDVKIAIESLFTEERTPEEFTRELTQETEISETMNMSRGERMSVPSHPVRAVQPSPRPRLRVPNRFPIRRWR